MCLLTLLLTPDTFIYCMETQFGRAQVFCCIDTGLFRSNKVSVKHATCTKKLKGMQLNNPAVRPITSASTLEVGVGLIAFCYTYTGVRLAHLLPTRTPCSTLISVFTLAFCSVTETAAIFEFEFDSCITHNILQRALVPFESFQYSFNIYLFNQPERLMY